MSNEQGQERQEYEKPALHIIDLAADEVLGTSCKNSSTTAPAGINPCTLGCLQDGS